MACGTCGLSTLYYTPGIDTDDVRIGGGGAYDGVGWYSVVLMQHFLSNATIFVYGVVESPPRRKKYSTAIFYATIFYTVFY